MNAFLHCRTAKKLLLIMKLTAILLLFGFMQVSATGYSQSTKFSFQAENKQIVEVLKEIEMSSDFRFFYIREQVDVERQVSLKAKNATLEDILDEIFAEKDISYKVMHDNLILLSPANNTINLESVASIPQKSVSGTITDKSGIPLPGVTIVIKGTTNGTITNSDGFYSLTNIPENAVLQFSFVGMQTQELAIANQTTVNITMQEETIGLEEIVAIGYGTIRKTELTSAVSNVSSENFIKGPARDAGQLIQGKVAGLNISQTNSNPVGESQISLRGITTLKSGASPLVIIDGVPGSLSMVAPQDIESINVLKDGSAAAIYGTRGTNGVILITTKGVQGEIKNTVEIDSYVSTQVITKKLDFMSAEQYRELVAQSKPGAIDYGSSTNWLDEVLQTPVSQEHNVNLKGGNSATNYIINLNYKSLEGIMRKSDNDVVTTRLEANHTMFNSKLKVNANILGRESKYFSGEDGGTYRNDVYRNALTYNPTDPVKDENNAWTEHISMNNYYNPAALVEETIGETKQTNLRTFGTITFTPINDLLIKLLASRNIFNSVKGYSETKDHISNLLTNKNGYASRGTTFDQNDLSEFTVQYNKSLQKHSFGILGGYSWQKGIYENYYMQNWDFPSDVYNYNNMGSGQALTRGEAVMFSYKNQTKLIGYFLRLNYNYNNKYLLMASLRHEGSSKFGTDHKWGNFPAISVGWNIKNESFMKEVNWLNNLKIRAGLGITGTEPSSPYMSLSRLNYSSYALVDGEWIQTLMPSTNANPDLRWEKKKEINIGMDFGIFKDRVSGAIDLYKRTTKDMLWDYNVSKPPYLYQTIVANAGTMENKGLEVHIDFIPVKNNNLVWTSTLNYSTNKNKLVSLSNDKFSIESGYFFAGNTGEPIQQNTHIVKEGEPIGNFYGYKTIGVDDDGYWIIEGEDGEAKSILDQSTSDKKVIGNGIPKHILSWDNSVSYKKFDFSVTMRGAFGYDIFNFSRLFYEVPVMLTRGNVLSTAYNDVYGKRPLNDQQSLDYVSYFIEKGNFWKIDNVTLGYNTPVSSNILKQLRIYLSCLNFATITNYSGIDPEVNILGLTPGIDNRGRYPSARTYSIGVKLIF